MAEAQALKCPHCSGALTLRWPGQSVRLCCPYCGSEIDLTQDPYKVVKAYEAVQNMVPFLKLGTRGQLFGAQWEVIGFIVKKDGSGDYQWDEYLLYNPVKGYRWLVQYNGHWNFVSQLKTPATDDGHTATYMNKNYELFQDGKAVVFQAVGEFYWELAKGDVSITRDFVSPPEMLSFESDKKTKDITWSLGTYIEPDLLATAFQLKESLPKPIGVSPNQPSSYTSIWPQLAKTMLWGCLILVVILFVDLFSSSSEVVMQTDAGSKTLTTSDFQLAGNGHNLDIRVDGSVNNSWIEVGADLINDKGQLAEELDFEVEKYSGYDSDGYWSEGSSRQTHTVSDVEGGSYHLVLDSQASVPNFHYQVVVRRDVPNFSNFVICLLILTLFPLFFWWLKRSFEVRRWSESDYSPYQKGGNDDDD